MKRERVSSEVGASTPKPSKKQMKCSEKTETPSQDTFQPFDYSQSNLKVFAGTSTRINGPSSFYDFSKVVKIAKINCLL